MRLTVCCSLLLCSLPVDALLWRRAAGTNQALIITVPLTNLGNQMYTANVQMGNADFTQELALGVASTYGYTMVAGKCTTCLVNQSAPRYNSTASKTFNATSNATATYHFGGKTMAGVLGTEDCALEEQNQTWWQYNNQTLFVANNNTSAGAFPVGSGIIGLGQSGVQSPGQSIIGQYLLANNSMWQNWTLAFALNGSDSSPALGTYGGVIHMNGLNPEFYAGNLAMMPVASSSDQAGFGTVPPQLGSWDWTVEMQEWSLDSVVNGTKKSFSGGQGGIFSTFESAYPYILLPYAAAEKIYSGIPDAQSYTLPLNTATTAGAVLTQDPLVQSWSVPCSSPNATLFFTFGNVTIPVTWQDLWADIGGGLCVGNVKGWLDQSRTTAIMGSVFWRGAYIVFNAQLNTAANTVGVASRNPLLTGDTATAVLHSNSAIIGGSVGGIGGFLLLVGIALFYLLLRRQKRAKMVAPSSMFINSHRQSSTPVEAPELEREKSVFGGLSGSRISLGSKHNSRSHHESRENDPYWIEPWTPSGTESLDTVVRRRDSGVTIKPWTPSMPSEKMSLSPTTTVASPPPLTSTSLYTRSTSSLNAQSPTALAEKLPYNSLPPNIAADLAGYIPRAQSAMSSAPSYATHDDLLQRHSLPLSPIQKRYSDGRLGSNWSQDSHYSSSFIPPVGTTDRKLPLNTLLEPGMGTFTPSPTSTMPRSALSSKSSPEPWLRQYATTSTQTPRPLPVPVVTFDATPPAATRRISRNYSAGVRPLPRPPRSQEEESGR